MQIELSGRWATLSLAATLYGQLLGQTAPAEPDLSRGDRMLADYFRGETARLSERCLADLNTLEDWTTRRGLYRQQLLEMLGLAPLPEKTDLKPLVTGKVETDSFAVEKLCFQSLPGLYVTADFYRPKSLAQPVPAILYVCGHGPVVKNGVSYGNKVSYQHHGAWFAQNGYVCLVIDTVQLGEIQGIHHGTYREGMWWWNARGYTPAGVEAWNGIRALDYLCTRPEVDTNRFGVTGRSGGGAYSWTIAALDERIKVAAPVAGITDLQNHVVDGVVEGHCDCMFFVNTYRWDYPQLAAMIAPRPLLIGNSDKDSIFPLDGVVRLHNKVRHIFELYGARTNLGLLITEGPHKDTQDLQLPVFRWFNRFLKGQDPLIEAAAKKSFEPEDLKVLREIPADQKNTSIHETFVPAARPPDLPASKADWAKQRNEWLARLPGKCFAGWPEKPGPLELRQVFSAEHGGVDLTAYEFTSERSVRLRLFSARHPHLKKPERVVLVLLNGEAWQQWIAGMRHAFSNELFPHEPKEQEPFKTDQDQFEKISRLLAANNSAFVYVVPRGIGPTAWSGDARKQVQIRRRFMLLGQTLDGMRVWDIRRAIEAIRSFRNLQGVPLSLEAAGDLAVDALYASLFEEGLTALDLRQLPASHRTGPDYLNVLRVLDIPQAVAMAAERSHIRLSETDSHGWDYPLAVAQRLGWNKKQLVIEPMSSAESK
jgi:dienelactone hydrolase